MTPAERSRRYRDKKRGGPPQRPAPVHGQASGMRAHERAHEPLCPACKAFRSARNAANYQKRKRAP